MVSILKSTHNLKTIEVSEEFETFIEQYLPNLEEIKVHDFSDDSFGTIANL